MPDKPNHEELGRPVVGAETDVPSVYDQRYGRYQEQQENVSPGARPHDKNPPFKLNG